MLNTLYKLDANLLSLPISRLIQVNSVNGSSIDSEEFTLMGSLVNSVYKCANTNGDITVGEIINHTGNIIEVSHAPGEIKNIIVIENQDEVIEEAQSIVDELSDSIDKTKALNYKTLELIYEKFNKPSEWADRFKKLVGYETMSNNVLNLTVNGSL